MRCFEGLLHIPGKPFAVADAEYPRGGAQTPKGVGGGNLLFFPKTA